MVKGNSPSRPPEKARKRRQDKVVEWSGQGYSSEQIARCLIPTIAITTVSSDRRDRQHEIAALRRNGLYHLSGMRERPDPEPYDWLTSPPEVPRPSYQATSPMGRIEALLPWLRETNAKSRLAHNTEEAAAAGDEEWFIHSQVVLAETIRYLSEMRDVLDSEVARQLAKHRTERDDLKIARVSGHGDLPYER